MVNGLLAAAVLVYILMFGEPVLKPLSDSSVCYWRNQKQASQDLARVSTGNIYICAGAHSNHTEVVINVFSY